MESRPKLFTNRFYVFDRDDTLLDRYDQIINPQFISEFTQTIKEAPDIQWAIATRGAMSSVLEDKGYKEIKKLYPEVEKKKPFYPIVTSLNSLLNCVVSVEGLKTEATDISLSSARKAFSALFNKEDRKKIQEESDVDLSNTKWTLQIGNTTVVFAVAQFDEKHQKLLVEGDYKLFGVLAALDLAGLKVKLTDELKAFGIVEIHTPENYQQIEQKNVVLVDDKPVNCESLQNAGFAAIHADTPVKSGENTYQSKLMETLPLHLTRNMQFYIDQLRTGDVIGFRESSKYLIEKYTPKFGQLDPETFTLILMYELAHTDIKEKDFKLMFDLQLLMEDLEEKSKFMAALGTAQAMKQRKECVETVLIHKHFNWSVFKEIQDLQLNNDDDLKTLKGLIYGNKTLQEQVDYIREKTRTPRSRDINEYKAKKYYQKFSAQYIGKTVQNILMKGRDTLSENDREILQQIMKEASPRKSPSSWLPSISFSFFSPQEAIPENRELAFTNLLKLCNYTKIVCKDTGNEKSLNLLRSIENLLIEEKSGLAKAPASQKQIEKWRKSMIQILLKSSGNEMKNLVNHLDSLNIGSEAFTKELSNIMEARHEAKATTQKKQEKGAEKEEKQTIQRLQSSNVSGYDHLLKLQIVGDSGTGKSNLLIRYADNTFSDRFVATIGVDFKTIMLNADNKTLKLQIWDTPGHQRFGLTPTLAEGSQGAIVVCDLTYEESISNIDGWFKTVHQESGSNLKEIMLVGNKADLLSESEQKLAEQRLKELAAKHGCRYAIVSAKTGYGVAEAFNQFAKSVKDIMVDEKKSQAIETPHPLRFK